MAAASCLAAVAPPFEDAAAVWRLGDLADSTGRTHLTMVGDVQPGVALAGAEREAAVRRGGTGRVAEFRGGFVVVRADGGWELAGQAMTLSARVRDPAGTWVGSLLARDDPADPYARLLYGRGETLEYQWRTVPLAERVQPGTMPGPRCGFNGECNDQHDLLSYEPGRFAISVLSLAPDGLVTLRHGGGAASGRIDPTLQKTGAAQLRLGAKHNDVEGLQGDIAEVVIWERVLTHDEAGSVESLLAAKWGLSAVTPPPVGAELPAGGLALHLDASVPASLDLAGGGHVRAWRDQSGRGRDLVQADPSRQPLRREASLNGLPTLRFDGAQWLEGPPALAEGAAAFTVVAVWRRDHGNGSEVIVEQASPGVGHRASLLAVGGYPAGRDLVDGVLRVGIPLASIGPTAWHDVAVRFHGVNLELFVDGVLVDEEWPHGSLYRFAVPFLIGAAWEQGGLTATFRGQIDTIALWERALSDVEITALAGGAEEVARRDAEILGPKQASPQYWKPRGHNAWAGDCMPFFHDGTFHMFYLFDRRHHGSRWGQGAHQYAHFTTADLVHWQEQPMAVPLVAQWECAMGTGDIIWRDGTYSIFYTDCGSRCEYRDKPQRGSWIFAATSTDGIHFTKDLKGIVPGGDCDLFQDPESGLFHLVRGGGNRLESSDLVHWRDVPGDFVARGPEVSAECPNHFRWNGWHYFILGRCAVWKSRHATGPWEPISPDLYDGLYVPKASPYREGRCLLAGWLGGPGYGWGGHLALRELVQRPDGSLGTTFLPELVPTTGEPVSLALVPGSAGVAGDAGALTLSAGDRPVVAALESVPPRSRVTLRVVPGGATGFGLCVGGTGAYGDLCELRFDPAQGRAQYGTPRDGGLAPDTARPPYEGYDFAIGNVTGLDQPFTLDIILRDDLVDTCIDGRRTLITRRPGRLQPGRLFLFARGGGVRFEGVAVRPLRE